MPYRTSIASVLLLLAGCGSQHPPVAPVRGVVSLDGKPLPQGRVSFEPVANPGNPEPGVPAYGKIQRDGSYVLSSYATDDGAVVGEHRVTIVGTVQDKEDRRVDRPPFEILRLVGQRFTVNDGQENVINFELTRQIVQRFAELED